MKKKLLIISLLSLILLSFTPKQSDKENITGYIYDIETDESLTGVKVTSNVDTTYTNFDGCFKIDVEKNITELKYSLISYEGDDIYILFPN